MILAGRTCPLDYALPEKTFAQPQYDPVETLFVAGGIYGNFQAMEALKELAAKEKDSLVVLNGDMHWFDKTVTDFRRIEKMAEPYLPLMGNVEAELRRESDIGVGCGCAYPDCVDQETVDRSNLIHQSLKKTFLLLPEGKEMLKNRPQVVVINVGKQRVAITHGDEKSLGGWQCSRESLADPKRQAELAQWLLDHRISVLATTHTCAPAALAWEQGAVINNGAAGMPNFAGNLYGLVTRISISPHQEAIYRGKVGELFVEALPLPYDHKAFLAWFDELWPAGSPAAVSYRERIINGPEDNLENALITGFVRRLATAETAYGK